MVTGIHSVRGPFFRYAEMLIENIYTTGQKLLYKEEP